jgi:hypothetical protein
MIISISKELYKVQIPQYTGEIKMLPFNLENINEIPVKFNEIINKMIEYLPNKSGIAYLTVDGKIIEKNSTHRRPGIHIDGNYLKVGDWGKGCGNGWKVGESGRKLNSVEHKLSYQSKTGGMLIASNYSACKGWNGIFNENPKEGGDCTHLKNLGEGFILKPNKVYYGNSQFLHESLPVDKELHRVLIRITLPTDYPVLDCK